jgi:hypothetical protein
MQPLCGHIIDSRSTGWCALNRILALLTNVLPWCTGVTGAPPRCCKTNEHSHHPAGTSKALGRSCAQLRPLDLQNGGLHCPTASTWTMLLLAPQLPALLVGIALRRKSCREPCRCLDHLLPTRRDLIIWHQANYSFCVGTASRKIYRSV